MNKRLLSLLLLVLVVMMPVNLWAQDEGGTTLKSNVYVGGDISMLPKYEEAEVEYKDSLGNTVNDVIAFFKQEGLNAMRVRLFVDPTKATDNEQKQGVCQDLNYVIALGKRIKDAGLSFLLDFHYSDTWADPGRQWTPDAWKTLDDDALAIQLYTYTKECLQQLKNAGAIPDMIQTGNEISYGMLWGVSGTTDNRCYTNSDNANWLRFFNLLGQTTKACREECPNAKIILHNERVNNISTLTDFYDRMQSANIDYDIIGLSYYPEFHGNLATLEEAISALEAKNYGKSIMLVETGYSYAWSITDGVKYDYTSTYPFTEEGQRQFTADLITMLNQHSSITGLFWWWPEDNGNKMVTSYWWNAGLYNHETGQPYAAFYELKNFVGNSPGFEPYAVLTTDSATILSQDSTGVTYGKTLTFYYDDQKEVRNGMNVGPFFGYPDDFPAWHSSAGSITQAVFDVSFANCSSITSTAYWFYECSKLSQIEGIENLKTDSVTDMNNMFRDCSSLTTLDVSSFNTANVTNMGSMFRGCSGLTTLDVSGFKTDNVTYMSDMFNGCSGLTSLDVSSFNTANVTYLDGMFYDCSGLTSLDVSGFKTDNVTGMSWLFSGCTGLTNLDVSGFKTDNVMNMFNMFSDCSGLRNLDVSGFKTDNVTDMSWMFSGCTGLTSLDLSNFKTDKVRNMSLMFYDCSGLTSLDVSYFNTANVTYMSYMFSGCSSLTSLDVSNFNTANVTYMNYMFYDCSGLTNLDVSNFKTDSVTDMGYMFSLCSGLTTLDVSNFKTDNVTNMFGMFSDCSGLTNLDVSSFNTANVTYMSYLFYDCSGLTSLDVSHFNTANVTNMESMFSGCSSLTSLDVSNFNTSNVTNMKAMFSGCSGLTNLDVSGFNTANVTTIALLFFNCYSLTSIDVSNFNTSRVTNMENVFGNCTSLTRIDVRNFDTSKVTNMNYMFGNTALSDIDVSNFNTENVEIMRWMFCGLPNIYRLDLSNFNTSKVKDIRGMFSYNEHLNTIYVGSGWNTNAVEKSDSIFINSWFIQGGAGTWYNQENIGLEYARVDGGEAAPGYLTSAEGLRKINVYVEAEKSPTLYSWDVKTHVFSANLIEKVTIQEREFWKGRLFSTSPIHILFADWSKQVDDYSNQTKDILYLLTDRYYTYDGANGYTDISDSYVDVPLVDINELTLAGNFNNWSYTANKFTEVDKNKSYSIEIDVTDFVGDTLSVMPIANGCAAIVNHLLTIDAPDFLIYDRSDININLKATTARIFNIVVNWEQTKQFEKNWTMKITPIEMSAEPYAVLTTDTTSVLPSDSTGVTYGKTLTFYYDDQKEAKGGMDVGLFESSSERGWNSNADSITVVVFDDSFANCTTLTSTALWFSGCRNLKTIVGIENLKTDHVTTMFAMFDCCNSLTSLDVSKFNTENVTRMNDMFSDCRSLTSLDVTNFNTAKVTDMCGMFINCSSLTSLDVSNFKTDSVTNMSFMFIECSGLTSLDLSNFNTAKVTDMSKMFAHCSGLTTIYVGEEWSTASVTDGTDMFKGCSAIKGGKGTTYSETFTIAYGNSTSSDYARIDYKGMPGYFTPKYGYTPEPTYTLEGNVLTIKAPIESSVYYVITDLYSGIDFESGDSLRIPETLYTGPLTLDHPVRVRFMAVNGRIAHSEIIVVKYKPIEATFDGRVLAVGGSTTMTDALEAVGGRDEVAKTITAIVWNSSATLTNSDLQGLDNPNLLIYVNERSQAPQNRNNVVVNGLAMNVVLSDTGSGNCDFYAPQTFTAEMITYSREFKQATQVGVCRGWETISLPFMVQTIAHADNGVITPFGVDSSNKHFWLRQLSTNGLVSATKIEANVPYLISMPNDEKNYAKEYILKGLVTFSAENAVVPKTEPTALALADSSVVMMPALQSVGKSSTVWALNVGQERSQYFEGSTFERDYREVRPFEAYTIHRSDSPAPRFLPINDLMNSATGIETISNVIMTHDNYYHLDGRKVDGKPTKKGLYITNGRKVVIK